MQLFITDRETNYKYDDIVNLNNEEVSKKLYKYFMKSHSLTRDINKKILFKYTINPSQSSLELSLLKLCDKPFFEACRVIEIIKDLSNKYDNIIVYTKYNELIQLFLDLLDISFSNLTFKEDRNNNPQKNFFKNIVKLSIGFINSFKIQECSDTKNIFITHNDKVSYEFYKPYKKDMLLYPYNSQAFNIKISNYSHHDNYLKYKFITSKSLIRVYKNYKKNYELINNSLIIPITLKKYYLSVLLTLEVNTQFIISLQDKFINLEYLHGIFDADSSIDYITFQLNKYDIKTVCHPHGINFQHKVNYISYGTNYYNFWSLNHLDRFKKSILNQNILCEKKITGNIVYTKTLLEKAQFKKKNILVVGEYFANDNFYSSPFNKETSKIFFDTLQDFAEKYTDINILIRARLNDDYYNLAKKYIGDNFKLSLTDKDLIDEINEHDLIISVFSNALHEALLLEKEVLQVNLLGIENYRDLAKDNLVYYADTKECFNNKLVDWYDNKLFKIDYSEHLKKYANNGIFNKWNK